MYVCIYIYIYLSLSIYIYIYIYIFGAETRTTLAPERRAGKKRAPCESQASSMLGEGVVSSRDIQFIPCMRAKVYFAFSFP